MLKLLFNIFCCKTNGFYVLQFSDCPNPLPYVDVTF